jgi:5'-3' exonuclease
MAGRLMLLDSASLYFRAFYGVPDSLKAPDGTAVNAVRGLLDFVATLTAQYHPEAMVACWDDDWRPAWRVDLLPSYKTHRVAEVVVGEPDIEETPDLLSPQVPIIAEALGLVGIPVVGAMGAEADDIIGTLAPAWGGPVDIVTGDRDLFQLVDDAAGVRVLYIARGVGRHERVTNDVVRDKYGIDASQYVDFAVMRGDASDGLPGVAGIGDKTAALLLKEFGDIDGILEAVQDRWSSIKPRVRQSLLDSGDYIAAARTVVAVKRDACDIELLTAPVQEDAFRTFGETWGLGGVTDRALKALLAE